MSRDPGWPPASDWLSGDHEHEPSAALALVGAPVRLGSISGGRFDRAPEAIRHSLARFSTAVVDPQGDVRAVAVRDLGDLDVADARPEDALPLIAGAVRQALAEADAVAVLGGDNSITRAAAHGLGEDLAQLGLLTVDAHVDFRDTAGGMTNGNPVRALIEDGLPGENVVQLGIQSFANSASYLEAAREAGITIVAAEQLRERGIHRAVRDALDALAARAGGIHVDLDLDVLDASFAPASPGARPGGLAVWELQRAAWLCGRHPAVRALDLVEVDPDRDVRGLTALAAGSSLLWFAAGLAARPSARPTARKD